MATGINNNNTFSSGLSPTQLNAEIDDTIKVAPLSVILDQTKTEGRKHRILLKNIVAWVTEAVQALGLQPQIPLGIAWITKPGAPVISNHSITETSSSLSNEGVTVNVSGTTVDVPFAAAGGRRTDAIVINYLATPAVYERIPGEEESELSPSPTPTIPDNRLFVRYVTVSDGIIEVVPNPSFVPITENEFGTHPAFNSQKELDAWLLANGGGDSGDGHTQNTDTGTNNRRWQVGQGATGNSSTFEAVGTENDIAVVLSPKGGGKVKLDGLSYTLSGDHVLVVNTQGELIGKFETSEEQVAVPVSLSASGIPGTWAADAGFLYFCTGANSWLKIPTVSSALEYSDFAVAPPSTTTFPAGLFIGQIAPDFPNGRIYIWDGSAWGWATINTAF